MPKLKALETLLHQEVPLSSHMAVSVDHYDGQQLTLKAELQPNINLHGTAFGGSLYSLCALTGWGLFHLQLEEQGVAADTVLGKAEIRYLLPVKGDLTAQSRESSASVIHAALDQLREKGRARAEVEIDILVESRVAAQFTGRYSILKRS